MEDTVGNITYVVKPLRGIPLGMLCRSTDVREALATSFETWKAWCNAGLPVISNVGANADMVFTDDLIEFLKSNPTIKKRPK